MKQEEDYVPVEMKRLNLSGLEKQMNKLAGKVLMTEIETHKETDRHVGGDITEQSEFQ